MISKSLRLSKHLGFTLIELVIVIAILGILSAIAIPKLINISGEAQTAATNGVAGALASAAAQNYAVRTASPTNTGTLGVSNCQTVAFLLQGGALPTGYSITSLPITADNTAICTLHGPNTTTATFPATGIS